MSDTLVVITANVVKASGNSKVDLEIIDGSNHRNVYQTKRNVNGETRIAVTTHADADLGVCFKATLDLRAFLSSASVRADMGADLAESEAHKHVRSVDLDVDIGADAVDYNAIAKQGPALRGNFPLA
jgi:hypothetical protein